MKKTSKLLILTLVLTMLMSLVVIFTVPAAAAEETVTVSISTYASSHGWANDTIYNELKMNEVITVTATGGAYTGKYFTSGTNWRLYMTDSGKFTMTAADGYTIVSASFVYTISNSGILVYNGTQYTSGAEIPINSDTAEFSASRTSGTKQGQVRVSSITVVYQATGGGTPDCEHTGGSATCTEQAICELCGQPYGDPAGHDFSAGGATCAKCSEPNPDYYAPITIEQALSATVGDKVQISGTVESIDTAWSDEHNNITVTITDGTHSIQLYRLATNVVRGDIITVKGVIGSYNDNNQIAAGATAIITGHDSSYDEIEYTEVGVTEVTDCTNGDYIKVTGTVVEIDSVKKYTYIADENGNRVLIYNYDGDVSLKQVITVYGQKGEYQGTAQIQNVDHHDDLGTHTCTKYNPIYTCVSRVCVVCGATAEPSTDHVFEDGECACGEPEVIPTYDVHFSVPAKFEKPATQNCSSIILPGVGAIDAYYNAYAYVFVGWAKAAINGSTTTSPTIYKAGDTVAITEETTFYAVFSYSTGASGFVKVTENLADWSGDYLIVYEAENFAFNGSLNALDAANNYVSIVINNGVIADGDNEQYMFTITKDGENYYILSASGYYIGQTSNENKLLSSKDTKYTNSISWNGESVDIICSGGAYMRFNTTSGQDRFRYFKSSSYTNQKEITLYKLQSGISYVTTLEHEHDFSEEVATDAYKATNATCTAKATYYYSCTCGEAGSEAFASGDFADHSFGELIDKVPATCTATGTKEHKVCSTCSQNFDKNGEVIANLTIDIDADNHTGNTENGGTEEAHTKYSCCGEVVSATHDMKGAYDNDGHWTACTCGYTTNKVAHSYSVAAVGGYLWSVDKTECTGTKSCTCGKTVTETVTVVITTDEATCTEEGTKTYTATFNDKAFVTQTQTDTISMKPHAYGDWIAEVPATCTANGTLGHYTCSVCSKDFDTNKNELNSLVISASGHTYGDWIAEVPATCTANGTLGHYTCSVCSKNFDTNKDELNSLVIAALGHSYGDWIAEVPATCTATGTKGHKVCSTCHKNFDSENVEIANLTIAIDADNHAGDVVDGGTEEAHTKYSCCGEVVSATHDMDYAYDNDGHWTECECGYETEKVAHNYNTPNKDANNHWYECNCGDKKNVTAHSYTGWTDIGAGNHKGTCTCGATTTETHTFEGEIQYSETQHWQECKCGATNKMNHFGGGATCTERAECTTCHQKYGEVAPNNHTGNIVNGGTEESHTKYSCCGATVSTVHNYETSVKIPATCTVMGTTTYTCQCGYSYDSQDIPALEHELAGSSFYRVVGEKLYTVRQCVRYGQGGCDHEELVEFDAEKLVEVANEADLRLALGAGYSVKLTADITLSECIHLTHAGHEIIINMNGKSLTNIDGISAYNVVDILWVQGELSVTITGNGTMEASYTGSAEVSVAIISATDGAHVVIENGEFISGGSANIYATRGGEIVINDGYFTGEEYKGNYYVLDINEDETLGSIVVNGGQFKNFNPANHTNDIPVSTNKLAAGLHAIKDANNVYTVGAHDYSDAEVVDPTCTADGYTRHTCVCGDSYNDSTVAATGHSFANNADGKYLVSAATCTNKAVYKKSCSVCGVAHETETFEHGSALGHDFSNGVSCENCGSQGVVKVNNDYYLSLEAAIAALEDGDVLTFNSNMVLDEPLYIYDSITIDTAECDIISIASQVIVIKGDGSNDPMTLTVTGRISLANTSAALMRTGGESLAQTLLTIEDVNNVTVILNAEFDLGAEDMIYSGDVENGYSISVKEAYASRLAAHGYITTPAGGGMVRVTEKSPYYIKNGNWWLGNVDTGIKATGTDGSNGSNGKSAYELAVEGGYEGTVTEWLASLVGETGAPGATGAPGERGKSAYEIAVEGGYEGTEEEWLKTLIGKDGAPGGTGKSAYELAKEVGGFEGTLEEWLESLAGAPGTPGKSAYELAVEGGYEGTVAEWLLSLAGQKGDKGDTGKSAYELAVEGGYEGTELEWLASLVGEKGDKGDTGLSAYEVAKKNGYTGTESEWLASLIGEKGDIGKSAYQLAVENGYEGTLQDWLASLAGDKGDTGKSAYEIAVEGGYEGTEEEWLNSLIGKPGTNGKSAYELAVEGGFDGTLSEWLDSLAGEDGVDGVDGDSAYEVAVKNGYEGTVTEWLASLVGKDGKDGVDGVNGKSAYELAVENGYKGTLQDWLASLVGKNGADGEDGKSAYELAVDNGYKGTLEDWLASLAGQKGDKGDKGDQGEPGTPGADGKTPHIGENGNWWIGDTDLGVKAEAADGTSGDTPHIGENGNWWIGDTDTGVKAEAQNGESNNKIVIICIAIAAVCILTTLVVVLTRNGRGWRIFF